MTWTERIVGASIGALVVGTIAALAGFGPERVATGLLALTAAVLGGALLDEFIESKSNLSSVASSALSTRPSTGRPGETAPERAATPSDADRRLPRAIPTQAPPDDQFEPTRPRAVVRPPDAHWVDVRRPVIDEPSGRWAGVGQRDLVATYLSTPAAPDMLCTRCGRTVARPAGDRPADCPADDGPVLCVLKDRHDCLVTDFRRLRDVSPEEPA